MKKALITLLTSLILITTIFFMVGCSDMMAKLGNISLTIDLDTPEVDVAAYTMEGSLLDSSSRFTLNNIVPPRHTLSELKEGRWNLTVKAFDDQDNQIGIGTKTVDLKAGQVVETSLLVEFGQSTPVLSTFTIAGPSRYDDREGSVAGTTTRMEYRLASAAADDPFTACTADTTQLVPGTYHIRLAQAHGLQASECLTFTVPAYQKIQLTIAAPTLTTTKEYDGTSTVQGSITPGALSGVRSGDEVVVHAQASYNSASVGNSKNITVAYSLSGADALNYTKPADTTIAGTISPKQLSISGTTVTTSKVYDGSTSATVENHGTLGGEVGTEKVTVTAHPVYQDKHAGTGKLISVSYTLGGAHAANYLAPANTSFSGTITKSSLAVTYTTTPQPTKVYDGTATAQIATTGSPVGVITGDTVQLLTTATYDAPDAGSPKSGTISYALSGADANNYTAPANGTFSSGTITTRPLTVTGYNLTASKPYDGNTNASIGSVAFNGKITADEVQVIATAAYDSATVSSEDLDKTITITYSLSGDDALNYLEPASSTADGTIVQKQLTVSGTDIASTKVYDGSTLATVESHGTLGGKVDGEVVTVTAHPVYQDRHAGTGKLINVSYTLGGTHAGNYLAPANTSFSGTITKSSLAVTYTTTPQPTKVYDGTATAQIATTGSPVGVITGDTVQLLTTATYDAPDAGSPKSGTISYALSGADANNYTAPANGTFSSGTITTRPLTVTGYNLTASKPYDGNTNASIGSVAFNGKITADEVQVIATAAYDSATVSSEDLDKTITITYSLSGDDALNYLEPASSTADGTIVQKQLTVSGTDIASTKVYDGSTLATVESHGTLGGKVDGEVVTVTAHPVYQDRHAGTGKLINVSYTLGGTHAGNYLAPANANFVGEITPKALEVSGTSVQLSKVYDGSTTAVVTASGSPSNLVSGDAVTVHAQASYDSADANEGKPLTVTYSISGANAKNYTAPAPSTYGSTGTITKRQLTVTVGNHTKIYGQENPSFTVNISGFVNGESASTAGGYVAPTASTAATTTTDTGTYEISTSGGIATNYSFNTSDTGTLIINKATYDMSAISFTDKTVTYNGTEQSLPISGTLPSGVTVSYTNNAKTDAGTYTATAHFSGDATNYEAIADKTATFIISKAVLTATVGDHARTYGAANPEFPVSVLGFVNGETASTANSYVAPTASTTTTTTNATDAGTYEISISGGSATNYSFNTSDTGTLTINKATYDMSAISFTDKTVTYNGTEQSLPISGTLPSGVTVSYTNNAKTDAGTYTATAHFSGDATNYEAIADKTATFIISKAVLTATVGDHARTYGAANPEFPVSVLGFVNGETASTANSYVAPTASTSATTSTAVGTATITISGGSATNYSFNTSDTGMLTINKATYDMSAISFTDKTVTYNGTEQSLPISGTLPSGVTVSYTNNAKTDAGTYTATAHFSGDATNYEAIADKTATFIISKAVLTATVGDHARTYGAANPEFPVSVLGFVNGETASTANSYVAPTASTSATTSTAVGTATITISGGSATNYSFNTSDTGMLTINKATYDMSAISFTDKTVTYNGTEQSLPISGTLPSGVTVSYTNNAKTDAGTYTATAHFSGDATNYEAIADKTATFIISKAVLTATVGDHARTYGAANPEFPVSVLGFVNGETASTANSYVAPTASTSATTSTAVGTATITISGGSATNYSFNTSDTGMLTINKATYDMSAISFTDKTVTYNGTEQSLPISGTLPSGVTVSYTNNAKTDAGTYTATAHFSGDATNYEAIADKTATFIISKAVLTATVGDHARTYGAANPEFPVSVLGFVNGETASTANSYVAPTASTSATTSTAVGTATITISGGSATNYSFNTSDTGMLTINKATYDMSAISFTDKTVTYNGTEQSLPISGTLPSGVTVSYTNNAKTDAGTYTATAHFSGDATNYEAIADKTATFIISKAVLTATVGDHARTYGAANPEFPVSVLGFVNGETASTANSYVAPTASTSATTSTAVGTATITISGGSATNYSFNTSDTGMLTINKATYDMSAISFTDKTVTYNGTEQSLPISGTLPSGVTVSYTNNAKTDAGTYTATAHFSGDATNYEAIADKSALLIIEPITMTGSVTLTGSCTYGETLTAVPTLTNAGPAPTYIWLRNGGLIAGATESTYTLTEADIGYSIKVAINATAGNYKGQVVSTAANISKAVGSALSGTFEAYYPIISASQTNITQDIINLIGFTANQTGIEASISTNGTTYGSYSSLEIDSRGRAMISVTSAQKIKLRYEATTTHYAGADLLLTVGEKDLAIGDYYAGGVVGYIYQSTDTGYMTNQVHGLIAAKADTSTNGSKWSSNNTLRIGTGVGIGTGSTNTDAIILALDGSEIGMYGAKEARLYTNGGYNDWFLPSWHELLQLRNNKLLIGNFDTSNWSTYMSSSESTQYGWDPKPFYHAVYFDTNLNNYVWDKPAATHIRAVRYF